MATPRSERAFASPVPSVTFTTFTGGGGSFWVTEKLTVVLSRTMVGYGSTVNVTVTFCGLLDATDDWIGTVAVYVPGANVPVAGCSVSVAGAVVPLSVAVVNHPLAPAPYVIVPTARPVSGVTPPLPLAIATVNAAGSAPFSVAVNVRLVGVSTIVGGSAMTVNVTATFCGLFGATED